jgi:hypothetical protein
VNITVVGGRKPFIGGKPRDDGYTCKVSKDVAKQLIENGLAVEDKKGSAK